tara:strand:- start:53 stop:442 length:390 start_codon:yes stop_codon:yes gene_type:complete
MKKLLLLTLLCFSINGFAVNWKKLFEDKFKDTYVDIDNIKKRNGLVYYWSLVDTLEPVVDSYGRVTYSNISKVKVDCVEEKLTMLNMIFYSQSMGKGKIVQDAPQTKTFYPIPGTSPYVHMKYACKNAK